MTLKPGTMLGQYEILDLIGKAAIRAATVKERPPKPSHLTMVEKPSIAEWANVGGGLLTPRLRSGQARAARMEKP